MEHVNGIVQFLDEVTRVLKPKGIFYTNFGPIWSSAQGHHVHARHGSKEARFWKPGRNPVPDYAHLYMDPGEMRACLREGPCCEELIEPIIEWVYQKDDINRCHFEEYVEAIHQCPLKLEQLRFGGEQHPDEETLQKLVEKHGRERNFRCSHISAFFRKMPGEGVQGRFLFNLVLGVSYKMRKLSRSNAAVLVAVRVADSTPGVRSIMRRLRQFKRSILGF
jgi:hypothetical protein